MSMPYYIQFILAFVPLASFIATIHYQQSTLRTNSLVRQQESLHAYSVELLTALQRLISMKSLYIEERRKIDFDEKNNKEISESRSSYVYDLKDRIKGLENQVDMLLGNIDLEITVVDFPDTSQQVKQLVGAIEGIVNITDSFQDFDRQSQKVFEHDSLEYIESLRRVLTATQNTLVEKINQSSHLFHFMR